MKMTSCFVSLLRLVLCGREVMGRLVEKKKRGRRRRKRRRR